MPHKFGINSPQSVKHISRKAFFKHALGYDVDGVKDVLGGGLVNRTGNITGCRHAFSSMSSIDSAI